MDQMDQLNQMSGQEPAAAEAEQAAEKTGGKRKEKKKKSVGQEILEWILTLLVAVAAALLIRSFIFEPIRVDGESMNDTLANGEVMFVSKYDYNSVWLSMPWQSDEEKEAMPRLASGLGSPSRYDVVICRYPGRGDTNFVKRLMGMPGDRIKIEDGYVWVNGEKQEEPYISDAYRVSGGSNGYSFQELRVPAAGDPVKLDYTDENQTRVALFVNGQAWPWRGIVCDAVSEDGDRLSYGRDGTLTLNGTDVTVDLKAILGLVGKEFRLEKDTYFVMGDHRNNSNDSRAQGPITRDMIVGHVRFVFFPFGSMRGIR